MINLPAELGWISKNLPLGPWPSGCALGPRALGQVFTDPPLLCWQVYPILVPQLVHMLQIEVGASGTLAEGWRMPSRQ